MSITVANTVATSAVFAPTEPQVRRLIALGVTEIPATRSEASKLIERLIAERDMKPATQAQIGRAGALGGRDLPGAGVREKSTQIYLLEALAAFDAAPEGEQANAAAEQLILRVRERFVKPERITITAPSFQDQRASQILTVGLANNQEEAMQLAQNHRAGDDRKLAPF